MKYLSLGNFKGFNSGLVVAKVSKSTAKLATPAAGSTPASSEVCADWQTNATPARCFLCKPLKPIPEEGTRLAYLPLMLSQWLDLGVKGHI